MNIHIPLWIRVLPVYFVIAGITFMPVVAKNIRVSRIDNQAVAISKNISNEKSDALITEVPRQILISAVGIDIEVIDGFYNATDGWSVSANKANYATTTPELNNQIGNTVIYGHDIATVFKPTDNLKVGDKAYLRTNSAVVFSYTYQGDSNVVPSDTSIFKDTESGSPRLTLITCSGTFSETRRIMNFSYSGVTK